MRGNKNQNKLPIWFSALTCFAICLCHLLRKASFPRRCHKHISGGCTAREPHRAINLNKPIIRMA